MSMMMNRTIGSTVVTRTIQTEAEILVANEAFSHRINDNLYNCYRKK